MSIFSPGLAYTIISSSSSVASASSISSSCANVRLAHINIATLIAALSIFCVLTGFGSWIAGSPVPVAFATRGVWIAILLVAGVALVPVWWRLAFPKPSGSG